jgi:hypothetical protein
VYAISIRQPYASMIVNGFRFVDIRPYPLPEGRAGTRIAIHASVHAVPQKALARIVHDSLPSCFGINPARIRVMHRFMAKAWAEYTVGRERIDPMFPRAAIVGTAVVQQSYQMKPSGMWVWPLTEVRRLEEPVPMSGSVRVWWTDKGIPLRAGTIEAGSCPAYLLKNNGKDLTQMLAYAYGPAKV